MITIQTNYGWYKVSEYIGRLMKPWLYELKYGMLSIGDVFRIIKLTPTQIAEIEKTFKEKKED